MPRQESSNPVRIPQSQMLAPFVHRHNLDGTVDSICTICARTVGSDEQESNLAAAEVRHICENPLRKPPQKAL